MPADIKNDAKLLIPPLWFLIGLVGVLLGLANRFIGDIELSIPLLNVSDVLSLVIYMFALGLVVAKILSPKTALLICILEMVRNVLAAFLLIGLAGADQPYAVESLMQLMLLSALASAVIGLASSTWLAWVLATVTMLIQFPAIYLYRDFPQIPEQTLTNCLVIFGGLLVISRYRVMLDHLLIDLDRSLETASVLKERAQLLNEDNRPFVVFGKNTAGLVHDFRNDVNSMFVTIQTMQINHARGRMPEVEDLDIIERSVFNLRQRIQWVKYSTGAAELRSDEMVSLRDVAESAIYPLAISREIREGVTISVNVGANTRLWGNRSRFIRIIENIVRNSCEALLEDKVRFADRSGRVLVEITGDDQAVSLRFQDNGPGIPACVNCDGKECMTCSCFAIGKTSKTHGSGYGIVNVRSSVKELGGSFAVNSTKAGTTMTISVPRSR